MKTFIGEFFKIMYYLCSLNANDSLIMEAIDMQPSASTEWGPSTFRHCKVCSDKLLSAQSSSMGICTVSNETMRINV